MSSDAPTTATEEAPRYDAFGFRLEAETGFASKNQDDYVLPDVVQRNRVHKWERVLDTYSLMPKDKVQALVEEGVPDAVRPRVWAALISDASKSVDSSYRKYLLMPDNKAVEQIKLDLNRTFTHHRMFEDRAGEGQQKLLRVLKAYSYHNPAVGYCQGMSYLAAILLTVLPEEAAFAGLCQVVGGIEGYFVPTMWELLEDGKLFKIMLQAEMRDLHDHLQNNGIMPLMFICKYFMTMFSQLPWPSVLRVFDLYLFEGKTTLFRFGFGLLSILHDELMAFATIDKLLPFLLEPVSRKLSAHVLVPHVLHVPIERYLRHAITAYRDEQDVLQQSATAGTPIKRAPQAPGGATPATMSSVSGAGGNASFFQRFLDSVATPIRSTIKRRMDPASGRLVATPPAAKRAFGPLSPMSPGAARLNQSSASRVGNSESATTQAAGSNLSTPPMFAGMKKRERRLEAEDDEENRMQSPFGSAAKRGGGVMSPRANAQEMTQMQDSTPRKMRAIV